MTGALIKKKIKIRKARPGCHKDDEMLKYRYDTQKEKKKFTAVRFIKNLK